MELFISEKKLTRTMRKQHKKSLWSANPNALSGSFIVEGVFLLMLFLLPLYCFIKQDQQTWLEEVAKYELTDLP